MMRRRPGLSPYSSRFLTTAGLSLVALLAGSTGLYGQAAVDINVGFGSAFDSASKQGLDYTNGLSCSTATDSTCVNSKSLSGLFMSFGGDVMLKEHFGAGFEWSFQPGHQDYNTGLGLKTRQSFGDIDGIYAPINRKKWNAQLMGGIGWATTSFAQTSGGCLGTALCTSSTQAIGSNSHFAVNVGAALQYFVWDKIFVKPEFKYHYVPNLTNQWGSNSVPSVMISVGYGSMR